MPLSSARLKTRDDRDYLTNEAPSSDVKHWAVDSPPSSSSTDTPPLGLMSRRPSSYTSQRSTSTKAFLEAHRRREGGDLRRGPIVDAALEPHDAFDEFHRRGTGAVGLPGPAVLEESAGGVLWLQHERGTIERREAVLVEIPSSSSWTATTPLGSMTSLPRVALHKSTATKMGTLGVMFAGNTKGTIEELVPLMALGSGRPVHLGDRCVPGSERRFGPAVDQRERRHRRRLHERSTIERREAASIRECPVLLLEDHRPLGSMTSLPLVE